MARLDSDSVPPDKLEISFGVKGSAGHRTIVIEDLNRRELETEIIKLEDEFYRVFNAYEDRKHLTVRCGDYFPTGSYIRERACEPQFLLLAHSENLMDSRIGDAGIIQSPVNLLSSRKSEFAELTAAMNRQLKEDRYFRELNTVLRALRDRLQELVI